MTSVFAPIIAITRTPMVIGQEKGHGAEFRNGGSVKPWGNAKAQQYMRVQTEWTEKD